MSNAFDKWLKENGKCQKSEKDIGSFMNCWRTCKKEVLQIIDSEIRNQEKLGFVVAEYYKKLYRKIVEEV